MICLIHTLHEEASELELRLSIPVSECRVHSLSIGDKLVTSPGFIPMQRLHQEARKEKAALLCRGES